MRRPSSFHSYAIAAGTAAPGPNEAVADVMGLGFDQVVRLRGSRVEVVALPSCGAEVLASFEAGTSATWPGCDLPFHGQDVLRAVGHDASRVAVVGERIAVSVVRCAADQSTSPWSDGRGWSALELYEPDGTFVTRRTFADGVAVTALDGMTVGGVAYLAVGLSTSGVRVVRADEPGLPDYHAVPADWRPELGRRDDREIVAAVRFGMTDDGRAMLASASITFDGAAIVATDVLDGRLLWSDNHRTDEPLNDRPTSVAMGRFGPAGVPTVSVAWSSGRLTLHDAALGTRPFAVEGHPDEPVVAQRFLTTEHGGRLLTVRRQVGAVVLMAGAEARASLLEVRTGVTAGRWMRRRNKAVLGAH